MNHKVVNLERSDRVAGDIDIAQFTFIIAAGCVAAVEHNFITARIAVIDASGMLQTGGGRRPPRESPEPVGWAVGGKIGKVNVLTNGNSSLTSRKVRNRCLLIAGYGDVACPGFSVCAGSIGYR